MIVYKFIESHQEASSFDYLSLASLIKRNGHVPMTIQDVLLSAKLPPRILRHSLFLGFSAITFHYQNDNRTFLYLACFLPTCVLAVYAYIYWLFPLLTGKRYGAFFFALLTISAAAWIINYFTSMLFLIDWQGDVDQGMYVRLAMHNQIVALCWGGLALSIKTTTSWYLRQKENLSLAEEKAWNELKLEKANLYPEFILQSLKSIEIKIRTDIDHSPELLVRLSDTLSYILYDSQEDKIELQKELMVVENIVEFKRLSHPGLKILLSVSGDQDNKVIVPLTLFRLLENIFQQLENDSEMLREIGIRLTVRNESLLLDLRGLYGQNRGRSWTDMYSRLTRLNTGGCDLNVDQKKDEQSMSLLVPVMKATITTGLEPQIV